VARDSFPSFSIVTVCLNNHEGLARTIQSVEAQTYSSWVQVIQDGASSDGTVALLTSLDDRFSVCSAPDHGIYDAMNRASARISGDLVWFLNAGDTFASIDVLQKVAASYRESRWRWAVGGMNWKRRSGQDAYRPPSIAKVWSVHWGLDIFPHPACILERSLVADLGGYSSRIRVAADQEFLLRALERSSPQLLPFAVADFEPGGGSAQMSINELESDLFDLRTVRGAHLLGSRRLDSYVSRAMVLGRAVKRVVSDGR